MVGSLRRVGAALLELIRSAKRLLRFCLSLFLSATPTPHPQPARTLGPPHIPAGRIGTPHPLPCQVADAVPIAVMRMWMGRMFPLSSYQVKLASRVHVTIPVAVQSRHCCTAHRALRAPTRAGSGQMQRAVDSAPVHCPPFTRKQQEGFFRFFFFFLFFFFLFFFLFLMVFLWMLRSRRHSEVTVATVVGFARTGDEADSLPSVPSPSPNPTPPPPTHHYAVLANRPDLRNNRWRARPDNRCPVRAGRANPRRERGAAAYEPQKGQARQAFRQRCRPDAGRRDGDHLRGCGNFDIVFDHLPPISQTLERCYPARAGGGALLVRMSIIRSSAKPTTTATTTSECAVQFHQKKKKKKKKAPY